MTLSTKELQFPLPQYEQVKIEKVMAELDHLKKQSERLDLINKLHARMAGILSLTGMIEAYSVWLMPLVTHELIGYDNSVRNKRHLFCSGHGPYRRKTVALAERLIDTGINFQHTRARQDGHYAYKWVFETIDDSGILLILKKGQELCEEDMGLINQSLEILADSLRRGLEYEDLFEKASNDPLTGLANRRVFDDRIEGMIGSAKRSNRPLTMVLMDLDSFKFINDNLGHQVGDEVLVSVANVLRHTVRSTDLLVRIGGDEFALVLDDTDLKSGRVLAERLCLGIDKLNVWASKDIKLGISIGVAELQENETLKQWFERTDDVLYHAKAEGRARVCS